MVYFVLHSDGSYFNNGFFGISNKWVWPADEVTENANHTLVTRLSWIYVIYDTLAQKITIGMSSLYQFKQMHWV